METLPASVSPSQMPESSRAQAFSMAYVRAIAAKAGVNIYRPEEDYGVDLAFAPINLRAGGRYTDTKGLPIPFQVKASKNWQIRDDHIIYDLEVKNYNDLVSSALGVLILMCLPPTFEEWLYQDEQYLRLHKCCYYWRPSSDCTETPNEYTKRIVIPRRQIFTPAALTALVNQAQKKVHP